MMAKVLEEAFSGPAWLFTRGENITDKPLLERKALLEKILEKDSLGRYYAYNSGSRCGFFEVVVEKGMEGIMAKKVASLEIAWYAFTEGKEALEKAKGKKNLLLTKLINFNYKLVLYSMNLGNQSNMI